MLLRHLGASSFSYYFIGDSVVQISLHLIIDPFWSQLCLFTVSNCKHLSDGKLHRSTFCKIWYSFIFICRSYWQWLVFGFKLTVIDLIELKRKFYLNKAPLNWSLGILNCMHFITTDNYGYVTLNHSSCIDVASWWSYFCSCFLWRRKVTDEDLFCLIYHLVSWVTVSIFWFYFHRFTSILW